MLPIGGLKEKILAAKRAKLSTVILPKRNAKDIEEIPKHLLRGVELVFADTMDDVMKAGLRSNTSPRTKTNSANRARPTRPKHNRHPMEKPRRRPHSQPFVPTISVSPFSLPRR